MLESGSNLFLCFRHKKNREAAVELLMRLKDNRDLQKFLQDCQEVSLSVKHQHLQADFGLSSTDIKG